MKHLLLAIVVSLLFVGCYEAHPSVCPGPVLVIPDAGFDGDAGMVDPLIRDFQVTVPTESPVILFPGDDASIRFRIARHPDFHDPILVRLCAVDDGITWQARENRPEDPDGILEIVLHADADMTSSAPLLACWSAESGGNVHSGRLVEIEVAEP